MARRKFKRTLVIADPHCGSEVGLTPPDYEVAVDGDADIRVLQREMWRNYTEMIDALKPIDIAILLGDGIEGKAERDGGKGLITANRNTQVDMCAEVVLRTGAKKKLILGGTRYHTGKDEDYEKQLADKVGADFSLHEFVRINGVNFDLKHHISGSSIPHGRFTALAREKLWSQLWAERKQQPKADVLLRAHVHYFVYCGGAGWLAVIVPPLQAGRTRYGARRMSGTVDWGLVYFDVYEDGSYLWDVDIRQLEGTRIKPKKL